MHVQTHTHGQGRTFIVDTVNVNGVSDFIKLAKKAPLKAGLVGLPVVEASLAIVVMAVTAAAIDNDASAFGWTSPPGKRIYIMILVRGVFLLPKAHSTR